jgi:hypothetical protein
VRLKVLFAAKVLFISILLFLIWPWVTAVYTLVISSTASALRELFSASQVAVLKEKYSYFLIPALAVILASSAGGKQKLRFCLLSFILLFAFDVFSLASGMQALAEGGSKFAESIASSLATVLYNSFGWTLPLFIILLFSGGKFNRLWQKGEMDTPKAKPCPICGETKVGLVEHIKAVHGEKSLKRWRVRHAIS